MNEKLNIGDVISQGISIGLKNAVSIVGAVILWILTIWVPYINVGTTIAITTLPLSLSKGSVISPLEIFDSKYRKYMGEYFMISGLKTIVMLPAMMFMVVPAIIIGISWSLGTLIMIDRGIDPSLALSDSNKATDGHKWTIFLSYFIFGIGFMVLSWIFGKIPVAGIILNLLLFLAFISVMLGMQAHIYAALTGQQKN